MYDSLDILGRIMSIVDIINRFVINNEYILFILYLTILITYII